MPRTVGLIQPLLLLLAVGLSRALARYWLGGMYQQQLKLAALPKVLIYGAGDAGRGLASAFSGSTELRIVGFLDDDDRLHGHVLNGLPIYNPADLNNLATTLNISDVLLAMHWRSHAFTAEQKARNVDYYERRTVRDSSL